MSLDPKLCLCIGHVMTTSLECTIKMSYQADQQKAMNGSFECDAQPLLAFMEVDDWMSES
jgi:hypothetical protein